jgi:5'-3' exonuclease
MKPIEYRASLMTTTSYTRADGASALETYLALPPAWRGACGPLLLVDVSPISYIVAFRDGRKVGNKPQIAVAVEITLGIKNYIRDMVKDVSPEAVVLVFDSPVKTLRSTLLGRYKAQRVKAREEFDEEKKKLNAARMEAVERLFSTPFTRPGCNVLRKDGYEADDLIAAFVHGLRVSPTGNRTTARQRIMIATSDKDMGQLLDFANVDMLDVAKRAYVTAKSFLQKKGYAPYQTSALLAIAGDTSDNIPGIEGIGEKTALKFLNGLELTTRERSLLEKGWSAAEEFFDLVKLPFPGCSLKGCQFDADLYVSPGDFIENESELPF